MLCLSFLTTFPYLIPIFACHISLSPRPFLLVLWLIKPMASCPLKRIPFSFRSSWRSPFILILYTILLFYIFLRSSLFTLHSFLKKKALYRPDARQRSDLGSCSLWRLNYSRVTFLFFLLPEQVLLFGMYHNFLYNVTKIS